MKPLARSHKLIVEEFPDEVLIYDVSAGRAYCLNRSAAAVWRGCDGTRGLPELVAYLSTRNLPADDEIVGFALSQLGQAGLLLHPEAEPTLRPIDRRKMLRRLAVAGMSSAVLPLLTSAQVAAQTRLGSCVPSSRCIPGLTECTPCHIGSTNQCARRVCRAGSCVNKGSTTCP